MSDQQDGPDKTGARHPDLPPESQGITQDEANRAGDLSDPENQRAAVARTLDAVGDTRELPDINKGGKHDPEQAAERGGALPKDPPEDATGRPSDAPAEG